MNQPDATQQISENEVFDKLDFFANVADKIENIRTLVEVFKFQLEPDSQINYGDEINLNLLKQIEDYATAAEDDIAWLLNNFDLTKVAATDE